jgi:hypothetical protein
VEAEQRRRAELVEEDAHRGVRGAALVQPRPKRCRPRRRPPRVSTAVVQPPLERAPRRTRQPRRVHRPHVLPGEERVQVREVTVAEVGLWPRGGGAAPLAQPAALRRGSLLGQPTAAQSPRERREPRGGGALGGAQRQRAHALGGGRSGGRGGAKGVRDHAEIERVVVREEAHSLLGI